jgi:ribosomal protein L17
MVTQLIEHERIRTTLPKAKELRRVAEQVVTMAKQADEPSRKRAQSVLRTPEAVTKLFDVMGPRYAYVAAVIRSLSRRKRANDKVFVFGGAGCVRAATRGSSRPTSARATAPRWPSLNTWTGADVVGLLQMLELLTDGVNAVDMQTR